MELSFIIAALRRYWFIPIVGALLGLVPAYVSSHNATDHYRSTAVLMLRPPDDTQVFAADPDRYVIGQLGLLKSDDVAEAVADKVGQGATVEDLHEVVSIVQHSATDLVDIKVTDPSPARAQEIANAYVDAYFAAVTAAADDSQKPDLDQIFAPSSATSMPRSRPGWRHTSQRRPGARIRAGSRPRVSIRSRLIW
jgi:capsular polysaccharide biosynthesis protein